jgi:hypothetical protein
MASPSSARFAEEESSTTDVVPFAQHVDIRPLGDQRLLSGGSLPELRAWIRPSRTRTHRRSRPSCWTPSFLRCTPCRASRCPFPPPRSPRTSLPPAAPEWAPSARYGQRQGSASTTPSCGPPRPTPGPRPASCAGSCASQPATAGPTASPGEQRSRPRARRRQPPTAASRNDSDGIPRLGDRLPRVVAWSTRDRAGHRWPGRFRRSRCPHRYLYATCSMQAVATSGAPSHLRRRCWLTPSRRVRGP